MFIVLNCDDMKTCEDILIVDEDIENDNDTEETVTIRTGTSEEGFVQFKYRRSYHLSQIRQADPQELTKTFFFVLLGIPIELA